MLFSLLPAHALSVLAAAWLGVASPASGALALAASPAAPTDTVSVTLYDENHHETRVVQIGRDGTVTPENEAVIDHLFRCKRTGNTHKMDRRLLAMIADVSAHFDGRTITFISGYRNGHEESRTSPHRAARALDFRVNGVSLIAVRNYVWRYYEDVGVGWYPKENFIHLDHRGKGQHSIAWTFLHGHEHYRPWWADRIREQAKLDERHQAGI